ncbi:bifunctional bis(5'-adenosyl)-triphosphatase/adenylylsulfatase FHIT-like [Papaver somniferum]|uniref:bifunctional bis(5'-adenosyl)-triphosphatase/adenylylsulfatase FHIT-like n=1 Tax=Papaver somniferum TaxID=3469 RepID=UPI000E702748|nr:bifunctional bis(5'-adenosyl)-triphosphatase/adenylylsulfatase FHIT-like [Papaver somniferum]
MAFSTSSASEEEYYMFGPYKVYHKEVFHTTQLTFAMVNLRPLLPGHVLICPKRVVKRFVDLTSEEATDLWLTAHKVGGTLEDHYQASSLTFTIQDGPEAGQTVPHVHIHILPRRAGDLMRRNGKHDRFYDAIDEKEKELKQGFDLDIVRKDRSWEERTQEAHVFRKLFP